MKQKLKATLIAVSITTGAWIGVVYPVHAAEWRGEFEAGDPHGPQDPVRIRLNLAPTVLSRLTLGVALDSIDVSTLLVFEDGRIVYRPVEPLSPGVHRVRLVEYGANKTIVDRGQWTFEVRGDPGTRNVSLQSSLDLKVSYRFADEDRSADPDRTQYQGAIGFRGSVAAPDWTVSGVVDILGNSNAQKTSTVAVAPSTTAATVTTPNSVAGSEQIDLGDYLFAASYKNLRATIGHQPIPNQSLIMQGYSRRGASVGYQSAEQGTEVVAFDLSAADIHGTGNGQYVVPDDQNRIVGFSVTQRPLPRAREELAISTVYVSGQGTDQTGTATIGDPTIAHGRASGIVLDSRWLNQRLRARGEYGRSVFDADGAGILNEPEPGTAYAGLMTYAPWQSLMVREWPMTLELGAESRTVGTRFRSLANPGLPADRRSNRGYFQAGWAGLFAQGSYGIERDNIEHLLPSFPTQTDISALSASYSPILAGNAPRPWYGQPFINLNWNSSDQRIVNPLPGINEKLRETEQVIATAGTSIGRWNWNIARNVGHNNDLFGFGATTRSRLTQINLNTQIVDGLQIGPMVSWGRTNTTRLVFVSTGATVRQITEAKTTLAGISLNYQWEGRLFSDFNWTSNRTTADDNSVDLHSNDWRAGIRYQVYRPQPRWPGVMVGLEGTIHDVDDNSSTVAVTTTSRYQAMLTLSMGWTPVWQ